MENKFNYHECKKLIREGTIPRGTAHNIIQSVIWGNKEYFK